MAKDQEQTYTEPELRERLKEQIKAGDKGGRPGQWSARKSQLLVREYEKAGGGYVDDGHLSPQQEHLKQWGEQDWHTASGAADARDADGTSRYLPDVAWQLLTPAERRATDTKKRGADEQHVANTDAAREARDAAELLTVKATEAQRRVRAMTTRSALEKARTAEQDHGTARTTVLRAVEQRLQSLG
jgi:hypothetical protein